MKKLSILKTCVITALMLGVAACSSTRHGGGADITDGSSGGFGGANANGASAQGFGGNGSGGFQPAVSCNVPHTSGSTTDAYYFDFNSNDVHAEDTSRLQSLGGNLASGHSNIRVIGNTDNRGSREYNLALGWRRANAVVNSLQQAGVPKQQINANSNGAEKPIAFGTSEDDFQCNRRVDVIYH